MSTTDEQSFTTPDGTRLALYWQGPRDVPVTIVLVHGWTLDSRTWGPVADALSTAKRVGDKLWAERGTSDADKQIIFERTACAVNFPGVNFGRECFDLDDCILDFPADFRRRRERPRLTLPTGR